MTTKANRARLLLHSLKSGSLVALHEACNTLRTGQSRMAIVGGTEIILLPDQNMVMSSGGSVKPNGSLVSSAPVS